MPSRQLLQFLEQAEAWAPEFVCVLKSLYFGLPYLAFFLSLCCGYSCLTGPSVELIVQLDFHVADFSLTLLLCLSLQYTLTGQDRSLHLSHSC